MHWKLDKTTGLALLIVIVAGLIVGADFAMRSWFEQRRLAAEADRMPPGRSTFPEPLTQSLEPALSEWDELTDAEREAWSEDLRDLSRSEVRELLQIRRKTGPVLKDAKHLGN
jgi:hypothetical protein